MMVTTLAVLLLALLSTFYQVEAQATGSLRLNNDGNTSPSNTAGVVEVHYNGGWGPICNQNTASSNLNYVVCHQLGYTGGSSKASPSSYTTSPVLGEMSCSSSNYLVVLQCSHSTPSSSCQPSDYIAVSCYSTRIWAVPYTGMVRLQNGAYAGEGRVEVYCNGQWGNVCGDNGFNSNTATTVCTQLGYNGHTATGSTSTTGITWLSNVYCSYSQSCLSTCATCPSSSVTCSDAATVTCNYDTDSSEFGSTRYTCGIDGSGLSTAALAGIVIAALIGFVVCCALAIGIPVCICCCCGIGIGAAASSRPKYSTI